MTGLKTCGSVIQKVFEVIIWKLPIVQRSGSGLHIQESRPFANAEQVIIPELKELEDTIL